jgi:pilus assembly protein Flp/PilA
MRPMIRCFLKDETGATAIEYGLIIAVLSLAIVGGVGTAADALNYLWGDNTSRLQRAINQ